MSQYNNIRKWGTPEKWEVVFASLSISPSRRAHARGSTPPIPLGPEPPSAAAWNKGTWVLVGFSARDFKVVMLLGGPGPPPQRDTQSWKGRVMSSTAERSCQSH